MDKTHFDIVSLFARMAPEVILAMDEGQYDGKVPNFFAGKVMRISWAI